MAEEKSVVEYNEETHEAIKIRGYVFIVPRNKDDKVRKIIESINQLLGGQ